MKINDIVSSAYSEFCGLIVNNMVISEGRTAEDLINDCMFQGLRKFKNKDVTWEDGYQYLKDTVFTELYFSKKRRDILFLLMDDLDVHKKKESISKNFYKEDE